MKNCFKIAGSSTSNNRSLALLRWSLVIVFIVFGVMKFTIYEANGIEPFMTNSFIMGWLPSLFGTLGASYFIGVLELATAAALIIGAFNPFFSALGAAMSCGTFLLTLTFLFTTPGVIDVSEQGVTIISAVPGQFLLKDLVLLCASFCLLLGSVNCPLSSNKL